MGKIPVIALIWGTTPNIYLHVPSIEDAIGSPILIRRVIRRMEKRYRLVFGDEQTQIMYHEIMAPDPDETQEM